MVSLLSLKPGLTEQEVACAVSVMAGLMRHCGRHDVYYRATGTAVEAMPIYDRHLKELREIFSSPVAFHVAIANALRTHSDQTCPKCIWGYQKR
ncbi:hypothetical protein SAMN05660880_01379 [Luteibacter sp. 22Crub2.1]|nr:hypothetical protein SAMN05660880_01379 [Luteibacter sp. 22Crub2.1]